MKITWYGQASFGLETDSGLRIVTDPTTPKPLALNPFPCGGCHYHVER
ncbi:MAG: MBL fold metallo-hydrolase [Deinococcales bacterium]